MPIPSPNRMFDHSLESSHQDDSNKWSNIGFGDETTHVESSEAHFTLLILGSVSRSDYCLCLNWTEAEDESVCARVCTISMSASCYK